jgi:hypothetical protein
MPVGWINQPPIYLAQSEEEAITALTRLKQNMQGWGAPAIPDRPGLHEEFETAAWNVWPGERGAWNDRVETSDGLVDDMLDELGEEDVWIYRVTGEPVGIMFLSGGQNWLHIEYLVTHPGSKDCGGVLIEKAVNLSVGAGYGGRLRLCAGNDNATEMYAHMGFVEKNEGPDNMELVPSTQGAKWQATPGGGYRFIPYLGGGLWAS